MRLRLASPDDVPTLQHWDTKPHVIAASGTTEPFDWMIDICRKLDWLEILIAEEEGRAIGVVQIIDPDREETHYWGDVGPGYRAIDLWIGEEEDLGKGHGTTMMKLAIARCFSEADVNAILIDPLETNTRAIHVYEKLGFEPVTDKKFELPDTRVMILRRGG